jgi:hypothetical protein
MAHDLPLSEALAAATRIMAGQALGRTVVSV